jgi:maltoporin
MRYLKSLFIAAVVFVMAAGTAFAEDSPLEIHGGGRIGFVVNTKGGSESGIPGTSGMTGSHWMGTMPSYGESNYFSLSIAKKVTSESGAWAKVSYTLDYSEGDADGDLQAHELRTRDFHVEFGGLDFMPEGSVLWAGLRGYGSGWVGMQDYSFINMAGIGAGIQNIGGIFSIAYIAQDNEPGFTYYENALAGDKDSKKLEGPFNDLGEPTMHNLIVSVTTPMIEVYAAVGYAPKWDVSTKIGNVDTNDDGIPDTDGDDIESLTNLYLGAIYHAPVLGLNVGAVFATNGYAAEIYGANYDTMFKNDKGNNTAGPVVGDTSDFQLFMLSAWTVTDLAPGLYIAPAVNYAMFIKGDDAGDTTVNRIGFAFRLSKALTQNIAIVPNVGYYRAWDSEDTEYEDPLQVIQGTLAVEIGLDTGYWAGQKIQFYGTVTNRDSDHEIEGGAFDGETTSICFGSLVTFGF